MLKIILITLLTMCCTKKNIEIPFFNKGGNEKLVEFCRNGSKDKVIELLNEEIESNFRDEENKTSIHYSVMYGWEDVVKMLLEKGADINIQDNEGYSPLYYSMLFEQNNITKLLIKNGADIDFKDEEGNTPLIRSIIRGNQRLAKLLIKAGANINDKDNKGRTALIYAVEEGDVEIIQMLLMKGDEFETKYKEKLEKLINERCDINFRDENGNSSLMLATSKGEFEIAKLLLEKGADVNFKNNNGISPLMIASKLGYKKLVKILLEKGANVNDRDLNNWNSLIHALDNEKLDSKIIEIIKMLISKRTDFNTDNTQDLILAYTAKHGNLEIMSMVAERGINIASYGKNALINALVNGHSHIATFLIDRGININNGQGEEFLMYATKYGCIEVVKILLKNGVNVNSKSISDDTPLINASIGTDSNPKDYNLEILKLLIEEGAEINDKNERGITPLTAASSGGHREIVKFLIERGANINNKDCDGKTALMYAAEKGNLEIANLLIGKGADVYAKDKKGKTALTYAIDFNKLEIVKLLVEKGTDFSIEKTELFESLYEANTKKAKLLLSLGFDINSIDLYGNSALLLAVRGGIPSRGSILNEKYLEYFNKHFKKRPKIISKNDFMEIVKILIDKGINVNSKNNSNGDTPLQAAIENKNIDLVKLLIDSDANIYDKYINNNSPLMYTSMQIKNFNERRNRREYLKIANIIIRKMAEDYINLFISLNKNIDTPQDLKDNINNHINLLYSLQNLPDDLFEKVIRYF